VDAAGDDIVGAWEGEGERGSGASGGAEEQPYEDWDGEGGEGYRCAVAWVKLFGRGFWSSVTLRCECHDGGLVPSWGFCN